jgi:hypothetical protein
LAIAQGSGKTLAFALPILQRLIVDRERRVERLKTKRAKQTANAPAPAPAAQSTPGKAGKGAAKGKGGVGAAGAADEEGPVSTLMVPNPKETPAQRKARLAKINRMWNRRYSDPAEQAAAHSAAAQMDAAAGAAAVADGPEDADDVAARSLAALIVTPTRELALQIVQHINAIAKFTAIQVRTQCAPSSAVHGRNCRAHRRSLHTRTRVCVPLLVFSVPVSLEGCLPRSRRVCCRIALR